MDKWNTATWLRKREVASMMSAKLLRQIDMQTVTDYWKQGLLPGKRLFGGRIVIFNKRDVEKLMEHLQTQEPLRGEQHGSLNGK